MKKLLKNWKYFSLGLLLLLNTLVWLSVLAVSPKDHITVSFLNIGQGDAILIESTNNNHILLDGGPNKKVLSELGKTMPFLNRDIDVLIESHPDKDHIGGLPEVVTRYHVDVFVEPGVESPNKVDDELRKRVEDKKIQHIFARTGQVIEMGDGSYLKILFPDRDVSGLETNDASVVSQFIYGDTCFLLTGDSPTKIEDYLVSKYQNDLKCDVLKAGHHGSRTSTGENYINYVLPKFAIISAGKDNSYGHPHREVMDRFTSHNIKILSTIDLGTINMVSDGNKVSQK